MRKIYIFLACFFLINMAAKAQDKTEFWDEYLDSDSTAVLSSEFPTIEIVYGLGIPRFKNDYIDRSFAEISSAELKLGFTKKKYDLFNQFGMSYKFTYFLIGTMTSDWKTNEENVQKLNSNVWKLGLGLSRGYGYNISEGCDFVLFNTGNTFWSKVGFKEKETTSPSAGNVLKIYDDGKFRFCQSFEAGFKFQLFSPLGIGASYERVVVYPRFLAWYWLGSEGLSSLGKGFIEYFTHKIAKSSPGAGPIVHFILINLYKYGEYELKKKNMDWPFATEPPLMYDNWKFGLTFAF